MNFTREYARRWVVSKGFQRIVILLMVPAIAAAACSSENKYKHKDEIFEICARLTACGLSEGTGMGGCSGWQYYLYSMLKKSDGTYEQLQVQRMECWRQAEDCESLLACHEVIPEEDEHCELDPIDGYQDICMDNTVVGCSSRTFSDCEALGLVCSENEYSAECGVDTCDPAGFEPRCDGELMVYCDSTGALIERHCSSQYDLKCGTNSEGELDCIGRGEDCPDGYQSRCEGTEMARCRGGKMSRADCAKLIPNTTCHDLDDNFWGLICIPKKECPSDFTEEACENGVITFCFMGEIATIDCREYGLSGCTTTDIAASCTP
jgi:hypothetical protein